jgi:WD40 repeat protein
VENIHLRLSGHDDEIPKSVKFSANSETLFSLTFEGQFCVWDISSLKRIHVKHFHKQSIAMIVCYLDEKILIALENEVKYK